MERDQLAQIISRAAARSVPAIEIIKRAEKTGARLGVLASSFNPVTRAHVELMRQAAERFGLEGTLALAGIANADKAAYEAPLEDRIAMLLECFANDREVSIGLSSHAYFVDMAGALAQVRPPPTELHFILGFDTFERVLDREDRYTQKYHRRFKDRVEAIECLLERSRLIVARRAGAGYGDFRALVEREPPCVADRVSYLDFPADLAERSASEVRDRMRAGLSISDLVQPVVEKYILQRRLYGPS